MSAHNRARQDARIAYDVRASPQATRRARAGTQRRGRGAASAGGPSGPCASEKPALDPDSERPYADGTAFAALDRPSSGRCDPRRNMRP